MLPTWWTTCSNLFSEVFAHESVILLQVNTISFIKTMPDHVSSNKRCSGMVQLLIWSATPYVYSQCCSIRLLSFSTLEKAYKRNPLKRRQEIEEAKLPLWFRSKTPDTSDSMQKLVPRWQLCVQWNGDCWQKNKNHWEGNGLGSILIWSSSNDAEQPRSYPFYTF